MTSTQTRIELTIPGKPIPLQRARKGPNGWYLPKRSAAYRELVQAEWMAAGRPTLGNRPFAGEFRFYGLHPQADIDNAIKAQLDALNGLAFDDDHRAIVVRAERLPVDTLKARAEVELWDVS